MAKQYPTVQEMMGIFGGIRAQQFTKKMQEADLQRQIRRDKSLSNTAREGIKLRELEHKLNEQKAETMRKHQSDQLKAELNRDMLSIKKEEFDQALHLRNLLQATDEIARSELKPDEKEDIEDYTERYGIARAMLKGFDLSEGEITQQLQYMRPLEGTPEKEFTKDEKMRILLQSGLISKVPEAFIPILEKEFGLTLDPKTLRTEEMEPEQRTMLSKVTDLLVDKRITAEEFTAATKKIKAGDLTTALEGLAIKAERPQAMSGAEITTMMAFAPNTEARYELLADNRTARTNREHHAVENTKGINEWEVVDYRGAKDLYEEGYISIEHLQKYNEYWEEREGKVTPADKTKTSGGFEY